ncbi:hypothetical protein AVEN_74679-1 [Araneus ventricosus]|uniref:Uncharacterized protein n=1 Tax=Araneus ventricosus TaxID=182803 RepID=A0A4Y2QRM2_ARAVE|nr:hypothetical protein AVEN_74678-1 [Araneus ventricosus]GBN65908.1 hypothetical protein AVEN_74679-1 [Araneus ventricosus]
MKRSEYPNLVTTKRRGIIPTEQDSAVLEEVSKSIPAEDKSDAIYFDGELTEYSGQNTDSETDVEDNPVHEEYSDSKSNTNVCIIHRFNL